MAYRYDELAPGNVYHVYTRAVEKRDIFLDTRDRYRFLDLLTHCLPTGTIQSYSTVKRFKYNEEKMASGKGLVDLLSYCLMENHFHVLLYENIDDGISRYMQRVLNSYAKYFNTKYDRVGSLFVRPFRAVWVDNDEQLLHVSRYIHLNPYVAHMVNNPLTYRWSSLIEYISRDKPSNHCHTALIKGMMSPKDYQAFVLDEANYARELGDIEHLLLDNDSDSP